MSNSDLQIELPAVPAPFFWNPQQQLEVELGAVSALFSTRLGGISTGAYTSLNAGLNTDDDPNSVAENRRRIAGMALKQPTQLLYGRQVHGADVIWTGSEMASLPAPVDADGQATDSLDFAPLVVVADCLPIIVAGQRTVAALHGGWRSLADGIIATAAAVFGLNGDSPLAAAIGPGISQTRFEVGEAVLAQFADHPGAADGRRLDLKRIAREQLEAVGVEAIHDCELCTYDSGGGELFFSHRRDSGVTGRQVGIGWLR